MSDNETINEFVVESREHLVDIENELLAIEARGSDIDVELVDKVFRAIHSIKGGAGFLRLAGLAQLAHRLESVLNLVRDRQLAPDAAITEVLLKCSDRVRGMIENIENSDAIDVSDCLGALQSILSGSPSAAPCGAPPPATSGGVAAAKGAVRPAEADAVETNRPAGTGATPDSSIRVAVDVLDRLMNLAGELVLARNQLLQSVKRSGQSSLHSVATRLSQVTAEIQETVMQTRLRPIATVFDRFPRLVRDLGNALGKPCGLVVEGREVELDKTILEAIGDPLTHLVRNAIDHGIEPSDSRIRAGKRPAGTITLRGSYQADKVVISISDDGRGIDASKLKKKAIARGLIHPDQAESLSDREALRWIFRPGFSTADTVTAISGRGVGMDVVKTNVERLSGTVDVDTESGIGTTVKLTLPLTVAIIPALVVRCAQCRFAIPQSSIRELVRVAAGDAGQQIACVKDAEVLRLRGSLLPLLRLDRAFDLSRGPAAAGRPGAVSIVVVDAGPLRYGLVVDALDDSQEIVVKPLGRHLRKCRCLAGATILGDGEVSLILDVSGVAAHCRLAPLKDDQLAEAARAMPHSLKERQWLLLFRSAPGEYFGIPLGLVTRVERIRVDQIDRVGGLSVLQYQGESLPLLWVEDCVRARPHEDRDKVCVVVFQAGRRRIGLIADEILDIREEPTNLDTTTFREPGIMGSLVANGTTVRVLDLYEATRKARPDWFAPEPPGADRSRHPATVLIAEDSDFLCQLLAAEVTA